MHINEDLEKAYNATFLVLKKKSILPAVALSRKSHEKDFLKGDNLLTYS